MRIHVLECGRVQIKRSQAVGRGRGLSRRLAPLTDSEWTEWLPIHAFAIEHAEGVLLVDTGGAAGLMKLPQWHPYFRSAVRFDVAPEQEAGPRLAALGIGARDVKTVVLTHMHIDHDGGLSHFPLSRVLVAPGELAAASGLRGRLAGYLPQRWPSGFDPQPLVLADQAFGPLARSLPLTSDKQIVALSTPGHTANHVSVAVDLGDRLAVIAGDATYSQANLEAGLVDGVSPNGRQAEETLARLRALARLRPVVVLPAHDPQSPARLAGAPSRTGSRITA